MMVVKMVCELVDLAALPGVADVAGDVAARVAELLRLALRHIAELVLGAGAVASGVLKTVNAKHLALACQSVAALNALVPWVRLRLSAHLRPEQAHVVAALRACQSDLEAHADALLAKLTAIVRDHSTKSLAALRADDIERPTAAMSTLLRGLSTVHKLV